MDILQQLGMLALASRFKRLTERLYKSGEQVYAALGIDFQPRHPGFSQYDGAVIEVLAFVDASRHIAPQHRRLGLRSI